MLCAPLSMSTPPTAVSTPPRQGVLCVYGCARVCRPEVLRRRRCLPLLLAIFTFGGSSSPLTWNSPSWLSWLVAEPQAPPASASQRGIKDGVSTALLSVWALGVRLRPCAWSKHSPPTTLPPPSFSQAEGSFCLLFLIVCFAPSHELLGIQ